MLAWTSWTRFFAAGLVAAFVALLVASAAEAGKKKDRNRGEDDDDDESYEETSAAAATPRAPYLQSIGGDSALVVWDCPGDGAPAVDFGFPGNYDRSATGSSE